MISYLFNHHFWLTAYFFLDDKTNFDSFHFSIQNIIFSKLPSSSALYNIWENTLPPNTTKYYRIGAIKRKSIRLRSNHAWKKETKKSTPVKTYNSV